MSGYIGVLPVPQTTQTRESFTATNGQTSFGTSGYQIDHLDVYLNGVKLAAADFTATNGSDIVLATGAALNDILEMVAFETFTIANQSFTGTTTVDTLVVTNTVDGRDVSVDGAKLDTIPIVSTSSTPSFTAKGDGISQDGYIQLNCSQNSHGIKLKAPPHSANASYTLTFPNDDGNANQFLKTNGSGVLSWATDSTTDSTKLPLAGGAMTGAITTNSTFDGVDVATRDAVLTSTTTTAGAALPKAGGAMTGVLSVSDGSVSSPSIANTGDLDTGISFPAINSIAISTAGTQRLVIDSAGFFDVSATGNDVARFSGLNSGSLVIRNDTANQVIMHTGTSDSLVLGTGGNNDRLTIDASGAASFGGTLGVAGLVSPAAGITVVGSTTVDDILLTAVALPGTGNPSIALRNSDNIVYHQSGSANQIAFLDSGQNTMALFHDDAISFSIDNSTALSIDGDRDVIVGTGGQLRVAGGAASAPSYSFTGDPDTGISRPTTNAVNIVAGGTERMRINATGVAVTGTTDTDTLVVGGSASMTSVAPLLVNYSATSKFFVGGVQKGVSNNIYYTGSAWQSLNNSVGGALMQVTTDGAFAFRRGTAAATPTVSYSMYINGSGDVLVNKTSPNGATVGGEIRATGLGVFTASGTNSLQARRLSNDGELVQFYKDSSKVGAIFSGHGGSQVGIGTNTTGITFNPSTRSVMPANPSSANPQLDSTIDLGYSTVRFKDIYLSGGVLLGGTGTPNKLDDYEEGSASSLGLPNDGTGFTSSGATFGNAKYVKIGALVNVRFSVTFAGTSGNWTAGDGFYITGMPFTNNSIRSSGSCWASQSWTAGNRVTGIAMAYNSSTAYVGIEYASGVSRSTILYCSVTFNNT